MQDSGIRQSQEAEYWFPYHYVARMPSVGFAHHFVDTWGINYISTIEFILNKIQEIKPRSLIDIGCGDGRLTREIGLSFPLIESKGVDYSQRAVNLATAMNEDIPGLSFERMDITEVNLPKKYDVAVLMEVFEHIPIGETQSFLSGVHRTIKPGGMLLLTVPHSNKALEYKHFQHFTAQCLTNELSSYFHIAEVILFEKRGFRRRLLDFVLCNRLFVLNSKTLLEICYLLHQKYLFTCENENECQRIFVKAIAK